MILTSDGGGAHRHTTTEMTFNINENILFTSGPSRCP